MSGENPEITGLCNGNQKFKYVMASSCQDGSWVDNWKKEVMSLKFNGADSASVQFSAYMPGKVNQIVKQH